jgi:hypothetical protein
MKINKYKEKIGKAISNVRANLCLYVLYTGIGLKNEKKVKKYQLG